LTGIRILKAAEVDILAEGTLDYPDELLKELDCAACSVHARFGLGKQEPTERILRAMCELDMDRIIHHARQHGCFFEINSSPDRLDLSAENARLASAAGVKIANSTDAHSTREFGAVKYGIDQARRAGLEPASVLNCLAWPSLQPLFRR
jgi:DNA polymerase (family X)